MLYNELKEIFIKHEAEHPTEHLTAYITFSSFGPKCRTQYTERGRTYIISSDNKAFQPNKGGYSIFGGCLDGTDPGVRLDKYMQDECPDGTWIVEKCCLVTYALQETKERVIQHPVFFTSFTAAMHEMLRRVADAAEINYDDLLKNYESWHPIFRDDEYGVIENSAWVNARVDGNIDWQISEIRIYDYHNITAQN